MMKKRKLKGEKVESFLVFRSLNIVLFPHPFGIWNSFHSKPEREKLSPSRLMN